MPHDSKPPHSLFQGHERNFETNRYVYPVLSRRAGGISIGVNLNLDKKCNFHCVYCQVDRSEASEKEFVDLQRLAVELDRMVDTVTSGELFGGPKFRHTPEPLRRLNDIALSGDGEPTVYRNFEQVVEVCAEVLRRHRLSEVKLVLISNASMFHRETVRQALKIMDANHGQIWAKLDAGTEAYYRQVARSTVPFDRILQNLAEVARERAITIQTLFMQIEGEPPTTEELQAYCDRLNEIVASGGQIEQVQIHTLARKPAEAWVTALSDAQINTVAGLVRDQTGLPVVASYGLH